MVYFDEGNGIMFTQLNSTQLNSTQLNSTQLNSTRLGSARLTKSVSKTLAIFGISAFCAAAPVQADIKTGLAAYWSFDDCQANDLSGNGNHGMLSGKLKCVDGKLGKALSFSGSTSLPSYVYVSSSDSLNPKNAWTMAFWVKVDAIAGNWSPLLHKGGPFQDGWSNREYSVWLGAYSSQSPYIHTSSAGDGSFEHAAKSPAISTGEWVHFAGVIDRVNHLTSIYLNGQKVAEQPDSYSSFNNNDADLLIGWTEEVHSAHSPFKGIMDEIRLYNRALSANDVTELYNNQSVAGTTTGLQSPYRVTCTNRSSGQTVRINSVTATAWDCQKAGLKVRVNQTVHIDIDGKAAATN